MQETLWNILTYGYKGFTHICERIKWVLWKWNHQRKLWTVIPHQSGTYDKNNKIIELGGKVLNEDTKVLNENAKYISIHGVRTNNAIYRLQRVPTEKAQQKQEKTFSKLAYWYALNKYNDTLRFERYDDQKSINQNSYVLNDNNDNLEEIIKAIHKDFADYNVTISKRFPLLWLVPPDAYKSIAKNKLFTLYTKNRVKYAKYRDENNYPTMIVELPKTWIQYTHDYGKACYPNGYYNNYYTALIYPSACLYVLEYEFRDFSSHPGWKSNNTLQHNIQRKKNDELCLEWMDKDKHFQAAIIGNGAGNPIGFEVYIVGDLNFCLRDIPDPQSPNEKIKPIVMVDIPKPKTTDAN